MKKLYLAGFLLFAAMQTYSQNPGTNTSLSNNPVEITSSETEEEVEEVDMEGESIEDIINTQGQITANVSTEKHFQSIWSRKGYFNISFNFAKLNPKEKYKTELNDPIENFTSNWGLGIQYGRNYNLLKNPISNMMMINIDFTPLDLNVNHYKKENAKYLFNSSSKTSDGYFYLPWNTEKIEYNYGMNVGPSVTLAPFINLANPEIRFLKFNVYYHIGYHVSLIQYRPQQANDANESSFGNIDDALKLSFGHGLTNAIGFNISWKAIGLGYESRWTSASYQSLDKEIFGKTKYKFKAPTNRIYLDIRI